VQYTQTVRLRAAVGVSSLQHLTIDLVCLGLFFFLRLFLWHLGGRKSIVCTSLMTAPDVTNVMEVLCAVSDWLST